LIDPLTKVIWQHGGQSSSSNTDWTANTPQVSLFCVVQFSANQEKVDDLTLCFAMSLKEVYSTFAVILCRDMSSNAIRVGQRIGRLGQRMLNRGDWFQRKLPEIYLHYYGHVGILFEPIQVSTSKQT
jgi:hypothetical protein